MCEKLSFDTFYEDQKIVIEAKTIRRRSRNKHRAMKIPQRCYRCPDCGKYHLTSKKKLNKTHIYK